MVQSHYKSCVFPYGTRWCILAQNTWHPRMCIRCTHKIVRYFVWISFSAALVKTMWDFQYKRGKAKVLLLYSSTFYTGGPLRKPKKPRGQVQGLSLVHFDPLCSCLFWWKISRYFKPVGCFWQSKNAISFFHTFPYCTEQQKYIILLWLTILGNYSFHWQPSILERNEILS